MVDEDKTEKKIKRASEKFSNVVDATGSFLKKTFPYAYAFVEKLRKNKK